MDVCPLWVLCVVRDLCDELITYPEESYRLWCVVVCDLETSWMRRPWLTGGRGAVAPKTNKLVVNSYQMTLLWGSDRTWWKESPSTLIELKCWLTQHHVAPIYQYECAFSPSVKLKRLMNMSKYGFNFEFWLCGWSFVTKNINAPWLTLLSGSRFEWIAGLALLHCNWDRKWVSILWFSSWDCSHKTPLTWLCSTFL